MKKILIGIIIIIPILVILSLNLVGNIVSTKAYVAVEKLTLTESEHVLSGVEDVFRLEAEILPKYATDKSVKFYIQQNSAGEVDVVLLDERFDASGDVKAAEVSDDGTVRVNTYCSFTVVCESTSSGIKAFCRVNVKQDKLEAVTPVFSQTEIFAGQRQQAELRLSPSDAKITGKVSWSSESPSVATVDGNGVVKGVSSGKAKITARIEENGQVIEGSATITVKSGAFKTDVLYTSKTEISLSEIANVSNVNVSGGRLENGNVVLLSDEVILTHGSETAKILKVSAGAVGFLNQDLIRGKKLFVQKPGVVLKPVYLETGAEIEGAVVVSSDESVAILDGNVVTPLSVGEVRFSFEWGGQTAEIEFKVARPVVYFYLNATEAADEKGVAAETVYGNKSFPSENLAEVEESRTFEIAVPEGLSADEFSWSTDDETLAWFDEEQPGVLQFAKNVDGIKTVTVKATAKNPLYESKPVERSYTFKLANAYNAKNQKEFEYVVNTLGEAVSLHGDAVLTAETGYKGFRYNVRANVYGNGYMVADYSYTADKNDDFICVRNSDVTVSNLTVRHREAIEEFNETNTFGKGITVGAVTPETTKRLTGVRIEYCVFEYCRHELVLDGSDVEITGTIFRNAAKYGLYSRTIKETGNYERLRYNTAGLENSVFSNMNGPAIGFSTYGTDKDDSPQEIDGKTYRMYSVLNLKGFVDFYNWKDLDNLDIVGEVVTNPALNESIKKLIQQKVSESGYDDFRYVAEDGKQYVNMAMLFAGLIDPSTSKVWIDGEEANDENLYDSQRLIVKEESIFGLNPFGFYGYDCTETEITPFTVLKIDGEYLRQLREGRAGSGEKQLG